MHFPFLIKIHGGGVEKPEIFMRKHPVILLSHMTVYLLLAVFPVIGYAILPELVNLWLEHAIYGPIVVLLLILFELCVLLFAYNSFMDWYLDIWVVTNERIVDINQSGVFGREIAELQLSKVQDVAVEERGVFATIFGFGKIRVQSAGEKVQFEFDGLAKPNEVQKKIIELVQKDQQWHREALAEQIKGVN